VTVWRIYLACAFVVLVMVALALFAPSPVL
jgi:hypothetical protein